MKLLMLSVVTLILCSTSKKAYLNPAIQKSCDTSFSLRYIFLGLGGNMWDMQPGFTVNGTKFIYTSEQVWGIPGEKIQIDTLAIGDIRQSSIDSINTLLNNTQDTFIQKINTHAISGGQADLGVLFNGKKIHFSLRNAGDTTAERIIDILNNYIPQRNDKLISFKNQFPTSK